jgi:glucokinase
VDPTSGRVLAHYGKYEDAMEVDLRAWCRSEFGLDLAIENDARMAGIGEWRYGAGRGCDNLVMVTLGTGLGTCAIMEGRAVRGAHHQAGVLGGHLTVRYGGRPCTCGNVGCAEAEASTARLKEIVPEEIDPSGSLDYARIFSLAQAGHPDAIRVRDHSLLVWSTLVVNLIHAYDPERVILGGGIMGSGDVILAAIRSHVERHAHTPWGRVEVMASQLGENAALVAGEWLLDEQFPQGSS